MEGSLEYDMASRVQGHCSFVPGWYDVGIAAGVDDLAAGRHLTFDFAASMQGRIPTRREERRNWRTPRPQPAFLVAGLGDGARSSWPL